VGEHDALVADMRLALRSEFGASYVYPALARMTRDDELASVLDELHLESREQVAALRKLMKELGGRPARGRFRRWVAAWVLALAAPFTGARLALRICCEAETTVARWYSEYSAYLIQAGLTDPARTCHELGAAKRRHAQVLETWVRHLPR
jgi:demethoxyubiquinone hydroxylase (CLK1/Coq7/Cat5 family)